MSHDILLFDLSVFNIFFGRVKSTIFEILTMNLDIFFQSQQILMEIFFVAFEPNAATLNVQQSWANFLIFFFSCITVFYRGAKQMILTLLEMGPAW